MLRASLVCLGLFALACAGPGKDDDDDGDDAVVGDGDADTDTDTDADSDADSDTDVAYEGDDAGECSDAADNDRDGDFDCDDADCAGSPDCVDAGPWDVAGDVAATFFVHDAPGENDCTGDFALTWDAERGTVEGTIECDAPDVEVEFSGDLVGTPRGTSFEGTWTARVGSAVADVDVAGYLTDGTLTATISGDGEFGWIDGTMDGTVR